MKAIGLNGIDTAWQISEEHAARIGKQGGIMNILKSKFFILTRKGSLSYSYAPFLASSHSSFGWGKSDTGKRMVNTLNEACS
jgi:hypothetical protein